MLKCLFYLVTAIYGQNYPKFYLRGFFHGLKGQNIFYFIVFHFIFVRILNLNFQMKGFSSKEYKEKLFRLDFFTRFSQPIGHNSLTVIFSSVRKLNLESKSQNIPIRLIGLTLPHFGNVSSKIVASNQ